MALTAAKVKALTKPGMHHDGRGLYLKSRAWRLERLDASGND